MPFDMVRLKKFYGMMLKIAILLTVVIGLLLFIAYMVNGGSPLNYVGRQEFIMMIVFLILEYVGYQIIHGKFRMPEEAQIRPRQQPIPVKQPIPAQIELDYCSFCSKEKPIHSLREFRDDYGNAILICENCVKKEGGK